MCWNGASFDWNSKAVGKLIAKLAAAREEAWLSANMAGASQGHSSASRLIGEEK
jgi:hypothetical protein